MRPGVCYGCSRWRASGFSLLVRGCWRARVVAFLLLFVCVVVFSDHIKLSGGTTASQLVHLTALRAVPTQVPAPLGVENRLSATQLPNSSDWECKWTPVGRGKGFDPMDCTALNWVGAPRTDIRR